MSGPKCAAIGGGSPDVGRMLRVVRFGGVTMLRAQETASRDQPPCSPMVNGTNQMRAIQPLRGLVTAMVVTAVLVGCGTPKAEETGPVGAETVKALEAVLHARADAMGRGDLEAFTQTIDTTKPAFRRMQRRIFDLPNDFISLQSSFKVSRAERYQGYVRAFVEMTNEGNGYFGVFKGERVQTRLYFREQGGRWVVTEPVGTQAGEQKRRVAGDTTIVYWTMDEDLGDVLAKEVADALAFAAQKAPKQVSFKLEVSYIPTAELAGPGWDATIGANNNGERATIYAPWYAFDNTQTHVSTYTRFTLRRLALDAMRDAVVGGSGPVVPRLINDVWLNIGWDLLVTDLDFTALLRQSCAGIPVPTFRQLADGPPQLGEAAAPAETYARSYGYSQSLVSYLFERFGSDAYWRLLDAYARNGASPASFSAVLKTTQEDFYGSWLTWLKKKYC